VASQNITCPAVTGICPVTVAVSVIAVPALTLFADTARAVVVVLPAPYAFGEEAKRHNSEISIAERILLFGIIAVTCFRTEFVT
jgi:hypothetical protein